MRQTEIKEKESEIEANLIDNRLSHPRILLLADEPAPEGLWSALGKLSTERTERTWSEVRLGKIVDEIIAVVLVPPAKMSLTRAILMVREQLDGEDVALFVILTEDANNAKARRLYAEGATAVFEWPLESGILPICIAEMIAVDFVRGSPNDSDAALARAARVQLKARSGFNCRVRVKVFDGVAFLVGTVDHLWQKERLREIAMEVPGLRSVVDRDIFIPPTGISDRELSAKIHRTLEDFSEIEAKTLAIRVENGYVVLAGSVTNRAELRRIVRVLSSLRGVRDIKTLTVVSPMQKMRDRIIAERLRRTLVESWSGRTVDVAFFGDRAVLSGRVPSLAAKQRIEECVNEENAVQRIINKIGVAYRSPED